MQGLTKHAIFFDEREGITQTTAHVIYAICEANESNKKERLSIEWLAERAGCSKEQAKKEIELLEKYHYLKIVHEDGGVRFETVPAEFFSTPNVVMDNRNLKIEAKGSFIWFVSLLDRDGAFVKTIDEITKQTKLSEKEVEEVLSDLEKEGYLKRAGNDRYILSHFEKSKQ